LTAWSFMGSASLITTVCCEAVRSAILATAWLLVLMNVTSSQQPTVQGGQGGQSIPPEHFSRFD